ncbi:Glucose-6-phosphatase [Chamberlinius hualienensis]
MGSYMMHIHKLGIEFTSFLQWVLQDYGEFFIWVSKVVDPRYMYLICFPLLFPWNRAAGIQVLWSAAISEWLNHVYKWLLFGERPYWWVFIHSYLWKDGAPIIQQFPITCETGPGSPSGHVMITSAVLYVCVKGVLEVWPCRKTLPVASVMFWTVYGVTVTCVCISRVYIAAHFPHQCVVGLLCGVILGHILGNGIAVSQLRLKYHCLMAVGTFVVAMATYYTILGLGIDPNWTLPLAKQWCTKSEWVHLNTTPFYMLWRYTATLLGIGLALFSTHYLPSNLIQRSGFITKGILSAAGVVTALTCEGFISKGSSPYAVYTTEFVVHAVLPIAIIAVVPWISQAIF